MVSLLQTAHRVWYEWLAKIKFPSQPYPKILKTYYQYSSLYKIHFQGPLSHLVAHLFRTRSKTRRPIMRRRDSRAKSLYGHAPAGQSWGHLAPRSPAERICSCRSHIEVGAFYSLALPEWKEKGNDPSTADAGAGQQPTAWLELLCGALEVLTLPQLHGLGKRSIPQYGGTLYSGNRASPHFPKQEVLCQMLYC